MSDSFLWQTPLQTDSVRSSTKFADAMSSDLDNPSIEGNFARNAIPPIVGGEKSRLSTWIEPDHIEPSHIPSHVSPHSPYSMEASAMSVSSIDNDKRQDPGLSPSMFGIGNGGSTTLFPRAGDATQKLQERYDQEQARRKDGNRVPQGLKSNYVCWSDGPQNQLIWNAVFVCPFTGECFETGTLLSLPSNWNLPPGWYGTKKMAIKAAAGRAEDCFKFRDVNDPRLTTLRFCREEPYQKPSCDSSDNHSGVLHIPPYIPAEQTQEIRILQDKALEGVLL